jgi:hypothetical protein
MRLSGTSRTQRRRDGDVHLRAAVEDARPPEEKRPKDMEGGGPPCSLHVNTRRLHHYSEYSGH